MRLGMRAGMHVDMRHGTVGEALGRGAHFEYRHVYTRTVVYELKKKPRASIRDD